MQSSLNSVQNYAWGSHTALTDLYGILNPDNLPMAELWMGAPKSSSRILNADGQRSRCARSVKPIKMPSSALTSPSVLTNCRSCSKYPGAPPSRSPSGFKPNKRVEIGCQRNAAVFTGCRRRNYKDPKPTTAGPGLRPAPFLAMNAFREFNEIVALLQPVAGAHPAYHEFIQQPDAGRLSQLARQPAEYERRRKAHALSMLQSALDREQGDVADHSSIAEFYPDDSGLFSAAARR